MKELYVIVCIRKIHAEFKDGDSITESCYNIISKDYQTLEAAYNVKQSYRYPENYIIVKYWQ